MFTCAAYIRNTGEVTIFAKLVIWGCTPRAGSPSFACRLGCGSTAGRTSMLGCYLAHLGLRPHCGLTHVAQYSWYIRCGETSRHTSGVGTRRDYAEAALAKEASVIWPG